MGATKLKAGLGSIVKNLYQIQFRFSGLSRQTVIGSSPLLGSDRGPQTDFNLLLLPKGSTSFMLGANDLAAKTTYNFAALSTFGNGIRAGGGILYSRFGVIGQFNRDRFGVEGRLYDPRRPTLDAYLNLNVNPSAMLFFGQRDLTRAERRTTFGLQLNF